MYKQIVVGTDGSPGANMAVDAAIELARLTGATLHVVNAHKMTTSYQLAAATEVGIAAGNIAESNEVLREQARARLRAGGRARRRVEESVPKRTAWPATRPTRC